MKNIYTILIKADTSKKYYTALVALCDAHPRDNIRVSLSKLQKFNFDLPYENDCCIIERAALKTRSDVLKEKEQQKKVIPAQFIWTKNILDYPEHYAQMFGIRGIAKELGGDIYYDNCDEWLLVVQDNVLLGFSGYERHNDSFTFKRAYVMPPFRGVGIYKEMFQKRYDRALELGCKILQAKTSVMSRSLFEKNGFFTIEKIPKRFVVYRKFL